MLTLFQVHSSMLPHSLSKNYLYRLGVVLPVLTFGLAMSFLVKSFINEAIHSLERFFWTCIGLALVLFLGSALLRRIILRMEISRGRVTKTILLQALRFWTRFVGTHLLLAGVIGGMCLGVLHLFNVQTWALVIIAMLASLIALSGIGIVSASLVAQKDQFALLGLCWRFPPQPDRDSRWKRCTAFYFLPARLQIALENERSTDPARDNRTLRNIVEAFSLERTKRQAQPVSLWEAEVKRSPRALKFARALWLLPLLLFLLLLLWRASDIFLPHLLSPKNLPVAQAPNASQAGDSQGSQSPSGDGQSQGSGQSQESGQEQEGRQTGDGQGSQQQSGNGQGQSSGEEQGRGQEQEGQQTGDSQGSQPQPGDGQGQSSGQEQGNEQGQEGQQTGDSRGSQPQSGDGQSQGPGQGQGQGSEQGQTPGQQQESSQGQNTGQQPGGGQGQESGQPQTGNQAQSTGNGQDQMAGAEAASGSAGGQGNGSSEPGSSSNQSGGENTGGSAGAAGQDKSSPSDGSQNTTGTEEGGNGLPPPAPMPPSGPNNVVSLDLDPLLPPPGDNDPEDSPGAGLPTPPPSQQGPGQDQPSIQSPRVSLPRLLQYIPNWIRLFFVK